MRISLKHQFVYFSIPKTASESVRRYLDPLSDVKIVTFPKTSADNPFYSHMTPLEAESAFNHFGWPYDRFFRFCTVRNPWDRIASLYMMSQGNRDFPYKVPFAEWLDLIGPDGSTNIKMGSKWFAHGTMTMSRFITGPNKDQSDIRCYRIEDQLPQLRADLTNHTGNSGVASAIPLINASSTSYDPASLYTSKERERVADIYHEDFKAFGYDLHI